MIRIFIPTYGRVHDQKTLRTLHPELHKLVTLFARKEEVKELKVEAKILAGTETAAAVFQLPAKYAKNGYISAMQCLFDQAGDEPFIYMDDDITALQRTIRFDSKATRAEKKMVEEGSRWTSTTLSNPSEQLKLLTAIVENVLVPHVATCSPRPPYIFPAGRLMRANGIMIAQHTNMFVAFNAGRIKEAGIAWGKHEGKICNNAVSDALFNLQLLNAGLDCRYDCRYSFKAVPMFAGNGGINVDEGELQRKQRVIDAHAQLAQLFPDALKLKKTVTRVKNSTSIDIPYLIQRSRFLKSSRKRLDPNGVIYEPENNTKMLEDWAAWGKLSREFHSFWNNPEDEEQHVRMRLLETEKYKADMKLWKKLH